MSEAFSAIISTQALMWAETRSGIAEASTTRSRSTPCTRNCGSTTAWGPVPITQVEAGWLAVAATFRIQLSISASVFTLGPGDTSAPRKRASGGWAATSRAILKPWRKRRQVVRRGEEVRHDLHLVARIVRAQQHLAAAVGMQQAGPDAVAVGIRLLPARNHSAAAGGAPRNMNSMLGTASSGRVLMKACKPPAPPWRVRCRTSRRASC
jgi:hypothetical protein